MLRSDGDRRQVAELLGGLNGDAAALIAPSEKREDTEGC